MRCFNKSGNRYTYNRHSLESIEVTRGNTATHPPNYFINGQQRQTTVNSANLNYDPTYRQLPSKWTNLRLFLMAVTTHSILPRYKLWRHPKGKFTRDCSNIFMQSDPGPSSRRVPRNFPTFRATSESNSQQHSLTFRTTPGPAHQW